jgi:phosphoribosylanthranilate isomerase
MSEPFYQIKEIIQIAGIIDLQEAQMLTNAGVDWLGFPLRLPVHKEDISDEDAAKIIASLKYPNAGVLITYLSKAKAVIDLCRKLGTRIVQLHGNIPALEIERLRQLQLTIIKSLIVKGNNFIELSEQVDAYSPLVDAFITDTHDPAIGADGATGKTHDWNISQKLVELSPKPIILAGGLKPENVGKAILKVRPAGVDAHTGVEGANGRKDREKIVQFVSEARKAFQLC